VFGGELPVVSLGTEGKKFVGELRVMCLWMKRRRKRGEVLTQTKVGKCVS
jgi:hypothetical protein